MVGGIFFCLLRQKLTLESMVDDLGGGDALGSMFLPASCLNKATSVTPILHVIALPWAPPRELGMPGKIAARRWTHLPVPASITL